MLKHNCVYDFVSHFPFETTLQYCFCFIFIAVILKDSVCLFQDLTAIGITKPAHRKRLKAEIARLHIHDGIPDFCPVGSPMHAHAHIHMHTHTHTQTHTQSKRERYHGHKMGGSRPVSVSLHLNCSTT